MADDVRLTDLQVIQRYSIAVRGETADRDELIAALQADLDWLQGSRSRPRVAASEVDDEPAPRRRAPATAGRTARGAAPAPARQAPARRAAATRAPIKPAKPAQSSTAKRTAKPATKTTKSAKSAKSTRSAAKPARRGR